jgi:G3E family GTPase
MTMKCISWNVNGLRACLKKGFMESFVKLDADVFALQETKMQPEQAILDLPGYRQYWNSAERKGYSGTAVFSRIEPLAVTYGLGIEEHDHEHCHHDHDDDDHDHDHCHHDHDEHEHHHHHDGEECDDPHCGCHHHHHHADEVFTSWGEETVKPFTEEQLHHILTTLDGGEYGQIVRAKGIVPNGEGKWLHFDYVPEEHEVRFGPADYTGRLCVIGANLDEHKLHELFGL